ncbi:unnamed protein product [Danaus chrysippus]|uniref:(African queen) hypothetical protein n=1 Tax=Danaus chrysippus TaxID=151541 RepID=A0A8J2W4T6_9NEOP|nr:unnamed protein product [Danaus chrysippus]
MSPNFPRSYPAGVACRWIVQCPDGYHCRARCGLGMPQTPTCSLDRLYISRTGDSQLNSAEYHCGRGFVNAVSIDSRLTFGLVTSTNSTGGRFKCLISTQPIITPRCSCGYKKTNRIVGGEETKPHEYPMMASIRYSDFGDAIKCGAVIIDRKYVLTAAHCVENKELDELTVVVGEHNVTTDGWGTTTFGGPKPKVLLKANVEVISQESCQRNISTLTPRQICTFTPGKDSCQDDSGGPLLYTDSYNGRLYNVGVVSFGQFCASTEPAINTRVTSFLNWIRKEAPANYCVPPVENVLIVSPNYPNSYPPESACRWIAVCPTGYKCRVDCDDVYLPGGQDCPTDRLLISRTGDSQLISAEYYCGQGSLSAVSTGSRISIGLVSSKQSTGGRFRCQIRAQQDSTPTCNCGYRKVSRIVGGEETKPNEYPMMAGIVYVGENTIKCGAVIIDNIYVLTAAHCVYSKGVNDIAVVVGEHDVRIGTDSPDIQVFRVSSIIIHPNYNSNTYDNDIAIIKIQGVIRYSENVGPVCLPFKFADVDLTGAVVTILGWGTLFPGGPSSSVLRKVNVNVISQSTCRQNVLSLTPRQICTFTRGKDACQDDSGGPLLYQDPSTGRLFNVGIVSFGQLCASNSPGINTRVTNFLNWVTTNAPANYCKI